MCPHLPYNRNDAVIQTLFTCEQKLNPHTLPGEQRYYKVCYNLEHYSNRFHLRDTEVFVSFYSVLRLYNFLVILTFSVKQYNIMEEKGISNLNTTNATQSVVYPLA